MKNLILITGGAGFIGSHTADALAKRGYAIRVLDNLQSEVHGGKWPSYVLGRGYDLMRGDVRKKTDVEKALKGVSFIYHLAAYQDQRLDFSRFFETNTTSTALIYECIVEKNLPIKKIVLASSQFVYGDGAYVCAHAGVEKELFYPELRPLTQFKKGAWDILCSHGKLAQHIPFKESHIVQPTNSYGLSKYSLEMAGIRLGKTYGISTVALRYSIVQGPRQSPKNIYSGALRIFIQQALAEVPITVYEDGLATRDFVNVRDVVSANILALTNKKMDFDIFNVGGGRACTVLDFAKEVKAITKSKSEILIGGYRRTDTRHAVSDIGKLKKFGWKPKFGTKEAIIDYVTWFKEEGLDKEIDRMALLGLKKGIMK